MNVWIQAVTEHHLNQVMYNAFIIAAVLVLLVFSLIHCQPYGLSWKKAMELVLPVCAIAIILAFVLHWVEHGFTNWGGKDVIRVFVWIPVIAYPLTRLLKIDWLRACDYLSPHLPVLQSVSKFGCLFTGCCKGYACSWGVYNPGLGQNVFPIQAVEALTSLIIAIVLCSRQKKQNYKVDGMSYPLMLILFGTCRFIEEFARNDEKIIFGLSRFALHAIFMVLIGVSVYCTLKEEQNQRQHGKRNEHKHYRS